jgi:hypothetical protein
VVLADTSVWVDFARRGKRGRAAEMQQLLDVGEVATCGPVTAELLAGAEGVVAERLWETLSSLPWAKLSGAGWREVGVAPAACEGAARRCRSQTSRSRSQPARAGHAVWSFDADFERVLPALEGLKLYGR